MPLPDLPGFLPFHEKTTDDQGRETYHFFYQDDDRFKAEQFIYDFFTDPDNDKAPFADDEVGAPSSIRDNKVWFMPDVQEQLIHASDVGKTMLDVCKTLCITYYSTTGKFTDKFINMVSYFEKQDPPTMYTAYMTAKQALFTSVMASCIKYGFIPPSN